MIKNKIIIVCLSFFLAIYPIHSKLQKPEQINTYDTANGIGGIEIQGEIDSHTANVVKEAFKVFEDKKFKSVVIHLNSPGGDVSAGADIVKEMLIAEKDYDMRVSTYVDHKEYCASMCTGIFAAGNFRVAAWDSTWVFHSPAFELTEEEKNDPEQMKIIDDDLLSSRKFLLNLYRLADPDWTDKVLLPHIMKANNPLKLTAVQIIDQTGFWFDYILEEDLTSK